MFGVVVLGFVFGAALGVITTYILGRYAYPSVAKYESLLKDAYKLCEDWNRLHTRAMKGWEKDSDRLDRILRDYGR